MKHATIGMLFLLFVGFTVDQAAAQWGTVTGQFVVKGNVVLLKPLVVTKDNAFCGNQLNDPLLTVGPKNELQDVALWLYLDRGDKAPTPHPMYAALAKKQVDVVNRGCLYEPQVALAVTGQNVKFSNQDPIAHNFKVEGFANGGLNNLVPAAGNFVHAFNDEERYPMNAGCTIHPWMKSFIVVRESPYMAVTDNLGNFKIENLPVGKHKLQIWHGKSGVIKEVTLGGKTLKDRKGVIEINVQPGQNNLGVITVDAAKL
ncbi:hypothetical protein GC197_04965 [bacterium]|nr:hypothetical protein [bacterium]